MSPYGASKAAAEMLMSAYANSYGVQGAALRLTNVYGPGMQDKDSVVPRLCRCAVNGTVFQIYGDGRQVRDYVYVDDVVDAVRRALVDDVDGPLVIGAGRSTSVCDLVEMMTSITGVALRTEHVPARLGEMSRVVVDNTRARSLGWAPTVDLDEGLARVWRWWCETTSVASSG
jgi:UDP-glucose 4-epimerase